MKFIFKDQITKKRIVKSFILGIILYGVTVTCIKNNQTLKYVVLGIGIIMNWFFTGITVIKKDDDKTM